MSDLMPRIDYDTTVDEIMRQRPATILVFLDFRMACVGCPIAPFHTVGDACREHRTDPVAFLEVLRAAAAAGEHLRSVPRGDAFGYAEQSMRIT
jgi:hybrid cluster-associated redox disulfide protein